MTSEPKVIFNPKSEKVEFMYDHQSYVFEPGEKKLMEGWVANHALMFSKTGLKEYEPEVDGLESSNVAYDKMTWKALKTLAAEKKVFKLGMKKTEVITALVEQDAKEGA